MKTQDWLDFVKKHSDAKIFYINHLKLLTNMNEHSLKIALVRLNNKKLIKRICRGFYANPFNTPALEEISNQICQPVISLWNRLYTPGAFLVKFYRF